MGDFNDLEKNELLEYSPTLGRQLTLANFNIYSEVYDNLIKEIDSKWGLLKPERRLGSFYQYGYSVHLPVYF